MNAFPIAHDAEFLAIGAQGPQGPIDRFPCPSTLRIVALIRITPDWHFRCKCFAFCRINIATVLSRAVVMSKYIIEDTLPIIRF